MLVFFNVEADELSRGPNLYEDLEWALDRRLCVGFVYIHFS